MTVKELKEFAWQAWISGTWYVQDNFKTEWRTDKVRTCSEWEKFERWFAVHVREESDGSPRIDLCL